MQIQVVDLLSVPKPPPKEAAKKLNKSPNQKLRILGPPKVTHTKKKKKNKNKKKNESNKTHHSHFRSTSVPDMPSSRSVPTRFRRLGSKAGTSLGELRKNKTKNKGLQLSVPTKTRRIKPAPPTISLEEARTKAINQQHLVDNALEFINVSSPNANATTEKHLDAFMIEASPTGWSPTSTPSLSPRESPLSSPRHLSSAFQSPSISPPTPLRHLSSAIQSPSISPSISPITSPHPPSRSLKSPSVSSLPSTRQLKSPLVSPYVSPQPLPRSLAKSSSKYLPIQQKLTTAGATDQISMDVSTPIHRKQDLDPLTKDSITSTTSALNDKSSIDFSGVVQLEGVGDNLTVFSAVDDFVSIDDETSFPPRYPPSPYNTPRVQMGQPTPQRIDEAEAETPSRKAFDRLQRSLREPMKSHTLFQPKGGQQQLPTLQDQQEDEDEEMTDAATTNLDSSKGYAIPKEMPSQQDPRLLTPPMETAAAAPTNMKDSPLQLRDLQSVQVLGCGAYGEVRLVVGPDFAPTRRSEAKASPRKKQRSLSNGRTYALKTVSKGYLVRLNNESLPFTEKLALTELRDHPMVVTLHKTFQNSENVYFLFDALLGGDLFALLNRFGPLLEDPCRFYAACVVSSLRYIHKKGFVYRDLKPENLMIDTDGYLITTDFGYAKDLTTKKAKEQQKFIEEKLFSQDLQTKLQHMKRQQDQEHTQTMGGVKQVSKHEEYLHYRKAQPVEDNYTRTFTMCGTPDYLPPEIVNGAGHSYGVDWWSLGVLLYEMLVGCMPFDAEYHSEKMEKIMMAQVEYPSFLSEHAQSLLQQLLDKDPRKRNPSHSLVWDHPFFNAINWEALERREVSAPWRPELQHGIDTSNFVLDELDLAGVPGAGGIEGRDVYVDDVGLDVFEGF